MYDQAAVDIQILQTLVQFVPPFGDVPNSLVELDVILVIEPLSFSLGINPELFCFLSESMAVIPCVSGHLKQTYLREDLLIGEHTN